jgi:exodeoxyribonuclease VII large subunit
LAVERLEAQVRADARDHMARARQDSTANLNTVAAGAVRLVHDVSRQSLALLNDVRTDAMQKVATARQRVPALITSIRTDALANVSEGSAGTTVAWNTIADRSAAATRSAVQALDTGIQRVAERAGATLDLARSNSLSLVREVTGQGPEKTLTRGFAIVRNDEGQTVTSSVQAQGSPVLQIQFRDGSTQVRTAPAKGRT